MQLSDKKYAKRLKEFGLRLVTTYKAGEKIIQKDSFETLQTDIKDGIRLEKKYFKGGKTVFELFGFDPRIKYTFVKALNAKECPNCGAPIDTHSGECPYCGAAYNMDYESKNLGTKYHTDLVMQSKSYRYITLLIAIVVSFLISLVYFKTTGRTFNGWDITKVIFGTMLLSLVSYYLFFYLDSFFILLPIKLYKERINSKQEKFWRDNSSEFSKNVFFTNLNYELQRYYFDSQENKNVVDFDFVDYTNISKEIINDKIFVNIDILVREVFYDGGKLKSRQMQKTLRLKKSPLEYSLDNVGGVVLRCRNCGTSVDAFQKQCPSCGTIQNYFQQWYLE